MQARREINCRLDRFIERGRTDGSIRAAVNATDVIVFSALITQPLAHGPDWPLIAGRQLAIFVNGLAANGPYEIPGPAVTRQDVETTFALRTAPERPGPAPVQQADPPDPAGPVGPADDPADLPAQRVR